MSRESEYVEQVDEGGKVLEGKGNVGGKERRGTEGQDEEEKERKDE